MLITIYPSRGRGITFLEGKLGWETLMHTNESCDYSKSRSALSAKSYIHLLSFQAEISLLMLRDYLLNHSVKKIEAEFRPLLQLCK